MLAELLQAADESVCHIRVIPFSRLQKGLKFVSWAWKKRPDVSQEAPALVMEIMACSPT